MASTLLQQKQTDLQTMKKCFASLFSMVETESTSITIRHLKFLVDYIVYIKAHNELGDS